jgi:HlyD family secretion protein
VKIGLSDGVNVQILKGLSVGDSVVTSQETVSAKGSSEPNAKSPFMPQRPGKKKK